MYLAIIQKGIQDPWSMINWNVACQPVMLTSLTESGQPESALPVHVKLAIDKQKVIFGGFVTDDRCSVPVTNPLA
jgi:hypothetical protein